MTVEAPLEPQPIKYFSSAPVKEGDVDRNGYSIHFKQFGTGGQKLMLIMGMRGTIENYFPLVNHFAQENSVLVLDNRGVGRSTEGKSFIYSTSSMAEDAKIVLDQMLWTDSKSVHLVGISMGGMVAQELAYLATDRFKSLTLLATYANFTIPNPRKVFETLKRKSNDEVEDFMLRIFSDEDWLDSYDERYPQYETNRKHMYEFLKARNAESPDRFFGLLGQMSAALTHKMKPDRLQKIGKEIPNVVCVLGTKDSIIEPMHTENLAKSLGCRLVKLENKGHSLVHEAEREVSELIEEMF